MCKNSWNGKKFLIFSSIFASIKTWWFCAHKRIKASGNPPIRLCYWHINCILICQCGFFSQKNFSFFFSSFYWIEIRRKKNFFVDSKFKRIIKIENASTWKNIFFSFTLTSWVIHVRLIRFKVKCQCVVDLITCGGAMQFPMTKTESNYGIASNVSI